MDDELDLLGRRRKWECLLHAREDGPIAAVEVDNIILMLICWLMMMLICCWLVYYYRLVSVNILWLVLISLLMLQLPRRRQRSRHGGGGDTHRHSCAAAAVSLPRRLVSADHLSPTKCAVYRSLFNVHPRSLCHASTTCSNRRGRETGKNGGDREQSVSEKEGEGGREGGGRRIEKENRKESEK